MEEIAQRFKEELQELLDRYKTQLSVPRIMGIAQSVFHKTLSFRYHPELHNLVDVNGLKVPAELIEKPNPEFRKMMQGEFKYVDCSAQMIAEADCDGDIRHCKDACHKRRI